LGGSFTAIMGPSGSGKSTLMHCLAGLDSITGGRVFLGGQEISALSDRELTRVRRDKVGFVFQSFNLLPVLTARQNIVLPLELAGRRPDHDHLEGIIASLGLGDRLEHRPSELSGGQQQRVAIARALITRPDVIFADEPTGALDSKNGQRLLAQLRLASRELQQTIVMVTHDPLAAAYADRALLLNDGVLVDDLDQPDANAVLAAMTRLGG
jgi:putative ABC transport system ATP-binding protein